MKDFIDYLKNHGIVEELIEFYQVEEDKIQKTIYKIVDKIKVSEQKDLDEMVVDPISFFYENNVKYRYRKYLGEIYTPISIIKYILNAIGYKSNNNLMNKRIIDISCGSGSFLICAISLLIEDVKRNIKSNKKFEFSILEYKNIISKVRENVYGIDINPLACILCQINIQYTLFDIYKIIKKVDENYHFPIFKIINENTLELIQLNNSHKIINKFDYVVGNPPYLFIRDIPKHQRFLIENSNLITGQGQYDYYQIFIELGLKILKNHGYLGYIVPDSILALSNRKILRKLIYNNTKINEVYHTGPEFDDPVVSNVIITVQKEKSEKERENNIIKIKHSSSRNVIFNEIPQKRIKNWNYNFLININNKDFIILDEINENFPTLKEIMKDKNYNIILSRGVELGKDGYIIYCKNCDKFYPLPKKDLKCRDCHSQLDKNLIETIIFKNNNVNRGKKLDPYVESINRYQIKKSKYIDLKKKGINYKDLKIYRDRIIIRQISQNNLICATYDEEMSLTSQSFYNLKINQSPVREFNNLYLLGLINSQLLSYYFIKSFGSYKKFFPRILIEKIKQLPIKVPETKKERKIAEDIATKVQYLLTSYDMNIQHEADSLVFEIYNINKENRGYILGVLKN